MTSKNIKMYGAEWCADCRRTKRYLEEHNIPFEYIYVDNDSEASDYVITLNKGKRIIPTLVIDEQVYSNPSINLLSSLVL